MRLRLGFDRTGFVDQLSRGIVAGGLTVVDAIERLLSEWLEDSIVRSLGDRVTKAPRAVVHPTYYPNRFQNLAVLARQGYSTWYPEVRFSVGKSDALEITDIQTSGFELESIRYGGGIERKFTHARKNLKTQVNHRIRLNHVSIPSDLFEQTILAAKTRTEISQPYIANLTVGYGNFVDDRIPGFRTVAFDHVLTGVRKFCRCHADAHAAMLTDVQARVSSFATGSWPHGVIGLLADAVYADGLCHFCVSDRHGPDAPVEWYGAQIQKHFHPFVDFLVRGREMDVRTATAEARRRLLINRWVREDELYQLISRLFPTRTIRREASPDWLGRLRLDIYLPELAFAVEHQGEQHYRPIKAFGGDKALAQLRERDRRKRMLCRKNGVTVVDVRFDDQLTIGSLRPRLSRWLVK